MIAAKKRKNLGNRDQRQQDGQRDAAETTGTVTRNRFGGSRIFEQLPLQLFPRLHQDVLRMFPGKNQSGDNNPHHNSHGQVCSHSNS